MHRIGAIGAMVILIAACAPPALAARGSGDIDPRAHADHIGGSFTACGRLTAFTAPLPATPGALSVSGIVDELEHNFTIADTATVDPLVGPLAAAGEWTCLDLVGDGMGVLTSVTVASASSQCGFIVNGAGTFVQSEGSTHEFTTIVFDGDAGALIAADATLTAFLTALAGVGTQASEACLDVTLAADGTVAGFALDYALTPGSDQGAPVACGLVDGTAIPYRDPASQPYPEGDTVSVDGFEIDAALVEAPYQSVLAFHLDAGLELCLALRIVDSAIVETAVITDIGQVCGTLEVIGGLVFVDTVVVSQQLTTINFAEPTPTSIDIACSSALAQEGAAAGTLDVCGSLDSIGTDTVTIAGVTFFLTHPAIAGELPATGTVGAFSIVGPHPFEPIDPADPAVVTITTLEGCEGEIPNTAQLPSTSPTAAPLVVLLWSVLLVAACLRRRAVGAR